MFIYDIKINSFLWHQWKFLEFYCGVCDDIDNYRWIKRNRAELCYISKHCLILPWQYIRDEAAPKRYVWVYFHWQNPGLFIYVLIILFPHWAETVTVWNTALSVTLIWRMGTLASVKRQWSLSFLTSSCARSR